jgi:hypothetical protein
MRNVVISLVFVVGVLATSACNKKQDIGQTATGEVAPGSISPSDSLATVTMTDGGRYRGAFVSKSGSQMTFRGDNGATRTIDSRDIQSIRFENAGTASVASNAPARSPDSYLSSVSLPNPAATPERMRSRSIIPSGTRISIRNNEAINSSTASAGQTFSAVVASDVVDDNGAVVIPRGSAATLVVSHAGAGKIHANDLALELTSIAVRGVPRDVQTGTRFQKGRDGVGANKRTAVFAGGGAAVGALIGGLVGGGKGAAIGAASGAGAGAGTQILTRGSVKIPSESLMSFTLEAPLAL